MRQRFMKQWMEDQLTDFLVDVIEDFLDTQMPEECPRPTRKEIDNWLYENEIVMRGK